MDIAADDLGRSLQQTGPGALRTILFDRIPQKAALAPEDAADVIEELRAFYRFLKREIGLAQADACQEVLDDRATQALRAALSDPEKFGFAKSLVMAGRANGYDVDTEEGLAAWLATLQPAAPPKSAPSRTSAKKGSKRKKPKRSGRKKKQ